MGFTITIDHDTTDHHTTDESCSESSSIANKQTYIDTAYDKSISTGDDYDEWSNPPRRPSSASPPSPRRRPSSRRRLSKSSKDSVPDHPVHIPNIQHTAGQPWYSQSSLGDASYVQPPVGHHAYAQHATAYPSYTRPPALSFSDAQPVTDDLPRAQSTATYPSYAQPATRDLTHVQPTGVYSPYLHANHGHLHNTHYFSGYSPYTYPMPGYPNNTQRLLEERQANQGGIYWRDTSNRNRLIHLTIPLRSNKKIIEDEESGLGKSDDLKLGSQRLRQNSKEKSNAEDFNIVSTQCVPAEDGCPIISLILMDERSMPSPKNIPCDILWRHLNHDILSFEQLYKQATEIQGIKDDDLAVVAQLLDKVQKTSEKKFVYGRYLEPITVVCKSPDGDVTKVYKTATFVSLPVFWLESPTERTSMKDSTGHPSRALLQSRSRLKSTDRRDQEQVIVESRPYEKRIVHIPQIWALIINRKIIITFAPFDAPVLCGDNIKIIPHAVAQVDEATWSIHFKNTDGHHFSLPLRLCKTWFGLVSYISSVCLDDPHHRVHDELLSAGTPYKIITEDGAIVNADTWPRMIEAKRGELLRLTLVNERVYSFAIEGHAISEWQKPSPPPSSPNTGDENLGDQLNLCPVTTSKTSYQVSALEQLHQLQCRLRDVILKAETTRADELKGMHMPVLEALICELTADPLGVKQCDVAGLENITFLRDPGRSENAKTKVREYDKCLLSIGYNGVAKENREPNQAEYADKAVDDSKTDDTDQAQDTYGNPETNSAIRTENSDEVGMVGEVRHGNFIRNAEEVEGIYDIEKADSTDELNQTNQLYEPDEGTQLWEAISNNVNSQEKKQKSGTVDPPSRSSNYVATKTSNQKHNDGSLSKTGMCSIMPRKPDPVITRGPLPLITSTHRPILDAEKQAWQPIVQNEKHEHPVTNQTNVGSIHRQWLGVTPKSLSHPQSPQLPFQMDQQPIHAYQVVPGSYNLQHSNGGTRGAYQPPSDRQIILFHEKLASSVNSKYQARDADASDVARLDEVKSGTKYTEEKPRLKKLLKLAREEVDRALSISNPTIVDGIVLPFETPRAAYLPIFLWPVGETYHDSLWTLSHKLAAVETENRGENRDSGGNVRRSRAPYNPEELILHTILKESHAKLGNMSVGPPEQWKNAVHYVVAESKTVLQVNQFLFEALQGDLDGLNHQGAQDQTSRDKIESLKEKSIIFGLSEKIFHAFVPREYESPLVDKYWGSVYEILSGKDRAALHNVSLHLEKLWDLIQDLHKGRCNENSNEQAIHIPQALPAAFQQLVMFFVLSSSPGNLETATVTSFENCKALLLEGKKQLILMTYTFDVRGGVDFKTVDPQTLMALMMSNLVTKISPEGECDLTEVYSEYAMDIQHMVRERASVQVYDKINLLQEEIGAIKAGLVQQNSVLRGFRSIIWENCHGTGLTTIVVDRILEKIEQRIEDFDELRVQADNARLLAAQSISLKAENNSKAILVFTVTTIIFLPLSFVTSYLGMNTSDLRSTNSGQSLFWTVGVPLTLVTLGFALVAAFFGSLRQRALRAMKWFKDKHD